MSSATAVAPPVVPDVVRPVPESRPDRSPVLRPLAALGLVLVASTGIQVAALVSTPLFADLGAPGVSGLRFALAAAVLLVLVRPRLRRSRHAWASAALLGLAMATMNVGLYLSLDRISLGLAVTIDFLGPFGVAVLAVRDARLAAVPAVGLLGVALVAGPSGAPDPVGVAFALVSAVAFGLYTVLAERVGRAGAGSEHLALATAVAAVVLLPVTVPSVPQLEAGHVGPLAVSALLGVVLAYRCDLLAVRLAGAPTVAVLFSVDPVLATVVESVAHGVRPSAVAVVGSVLVSVAGATTVGLAARRRAC